MSLRVRGRLAKFAATPLDFDRHGVVVCMHKPLALDQIVFLTIADRGLGLDQIVGVVHNCRSLGADGYRCGIRFRTQSKDQMDKDLVESILLRLEHAHRNDAPPAAP